MAAQNRNCKVKRLALMGLLFALAMALSFLESLLPALPMLPPGIRLGLSNIVTMYALFVLGPVSGYTIAVLKSLFVLLTRGAVAAAMSASGGIASVTVMLLLSLLPGIRRQYLLLSVFGGAAHQLRLADSPAVGQQHVNPGSSRPGSSSAINMFGTTCRFF